MERMKENRLRRVMFLIHLRWMATMCTLYNTISYQPRFYRVE
jgi:hypothetical protein